ncbi:MAG: ABC transporter permease [Acidimicrobiales bacterium]
MAREIAEIETVRSPDSLDDELAELAAGDIGPTSAGRPAGETTPSSVPHRWFGPGAVRERVRAILPPLLGIGIFLLAWAAVAPQVKTSLGSLPGPSQVASQGTSLYREWRAASAEEARFYRDQTQRNAALAAEGRSSQVQHFKYSGPPTFVDQIWTSLRTVGLGFSLATLIGVSVGLIGGLSKTFRAAINPLVQIMKPVSPLAWLPIVTMVISATVTSNNPLLPKSFLISAIVVALCSVWPTLINTSVGAAAVDQDLMNVARVLKLGWFARLRKVVIPSALPYIFTGMRLSLGVGWMVLIAAEMLSQNPGLGKFVWDQFQNGSSQSLARIMFAVFVIGFLGYTLDRIMSGLQKLASRNHVV